MIQNGGSVLAGPASPAGTRCSAVAVCLRRCAGEVRVEVARVAGDLLADGVFEPLADFVFEKLDGLAVLPNGDAYIVNDNDGVDDNSGETQLINLGQIL